MATFVLVHGAYHGAWCWSRLVPKLQAAGHQVIAPDLPGHGDDRASMADVSLQSYAHRIAEIAAAADNPVVLVGHSMAGAVIAMAAETAPEHIGRLVFLTAYIPASGESLTDQVRRDTQFRIPVERCERDGVACLRMSDDVARRHFYFDAVGEDFEWVRGRLQVQPVGPFTERLTLSASRFGQLAKAYIHCKEDHAIGFSLQRRMARAAGCDPTVILNSGHSPFLTHPDDLAESLLAL